MLELDLSEQHLLSSMSRECVHFLRPRFRNINGAMEFHSCQDFLEASGFVDSQQGLEFRLNRTISHKHSQNRSVLSRTC